MLVLIQEEGFLPKRANRSFYGGSTMRQLSQKRHEALRQTIVEAAKADLPERAYLVMGKGKMVLVTTADHKPVRGAKPIGIKEYYKN